MASKSPGTVVWNSEEPLDPAVAKDNAASERSVRRNFTMMCFCFGVNHATQTTAIAYASTSLDENVGSASNAALYATCMFSSLFLGPLSVGVAGPKKGLLFGMWTYVLYVLGFGVAGFFPMDSMERWVFAIGAAFIGGVGAGVLWTCQGAFFTAVADQLCVSGGATPGGATRMMVTSQLSSLFAIWFLSTECLCKIAYALIKQNFDIPNGSGFIAFGLLAAAATIAFTFVPDVQSSTLAPSSSCCGKAAAAIKLWPDPKIWLLCGSNISFGFAAAWVNGFVNAHWLKEAIDNEAFIGYLSALICLVAAVSARIYGFICDRLGSKLPVAFFGSICLFSISGLSFAIFIGGKGAAGWGAGIVSFYVLLGLGRGVYESTNKGIFADFYPGELGTGGFANCLMQNTASSAIGFVFGAVDVELPVVWLLMAFSALTMPGLVLAYMLQRRGERSGLDVRNASTSFLDAPSS